MERQFRHAKFFLGDDRTRQSHGVIVECSKCPFVFRMPITNASSSLPNEVIAKKLRLGGWQIGRNDKDDICPQCVKNEQLARRLRRQQVAPPNAIKPSAEIITMTLKAEAPEKPTAADSRLIFQKLEEVYDEDVKGYSDNWTDAVVAKDMGVPVAWVADIREKFFGPARDNAAIRKAIEEADKYLAELPQIKQQVRDIQNTQHMLGQRMLELSTQGEKIKALLEKIRSVL